MSNLKYIFYTFLFIGPPMLDIVPQASIGSLNPEMSIQVNIPGLFLPMFIPVSRMGLVRFPTCLAIMNPGSSSIEDCWSCRMRNWHYRIVNKSLTFSTC